MIVNRVAVALWKCIPLAIVVCGASASQAPSQQLTRDQLELIREHAREVCQTVKDARGQRTESQLQADVQAKAAGLWGKLIDFGGGAKGTIGRETFEGLSREATAALLTGDRECRERINARLLGAALQNTLQGTPNPELKAAPAIAPPQVKAAPEAHSVTQSCNLTSSVRLENVSRDSLCCHYGSGSCTIFLMAPFGQEGKRLSEIYCSCPGSGSSSGKVGLRVRP